MAKFNEQLIFVRELLEEDKERCGNYLKALLPAEQYEQLYKDWVGAYGGKPSSYPLWRYALEHINVSYTTSPKSLPSRLVRNMKDGRFELIKHEHYLNACKCGCELFHYEYDVDDGKMYTVCDACGNDFAMLSPVLAKELLVTGVWTGKP